MIFESKINKYPGKRFYKEMGVEITANVKEGKTKIFEDRNEAEVYARQARSYVEGVRYTEAPKHDKIKIYGYGVPK
jgi:hypothetical protein